MSTGHIAYELATMKPRVTQLQPLSTYGSGRSRAVMSQQYAHIFFDAVSFVLRRIIILPRFKIELVAIVELLIFLSRLGPLIG